MTETEALDILHTVRATLGRTYKSAIRQAWMDGNYGAQCLEQWAFDLQRIRNTFGPSWLVRAVPAIKQSAYVKLDQSVKHLPVLLGREMPHHIQVAWGRHIFRLAHGGRNCGLWLRDLPLNMYDLSWDYGFHEAILEYRRECIRTSQTPQF